MTLEPLLGSTALSDVSTFVRELQAAVLEVCVETRRHFFLHEVDFRQHEVESRQHDFDFRQPEVDLKPSANKKLALGPRQMTS